MNNTNKFGDWGLGIGDCNPQSPIPNKLNNKQNVT